MGKVTIVACLLIIAGVVLLAVGRMRIRPEVKQARACYDFVLTPAEIAYLYARGPQDFQATVQRWQKEKQPPKVATPPTKPKSAPED